MKKIKPKYNVWQNTVYVLRGAWVRDKIVIWTMLAQIVLTPAIPAVAMFLPKTVVAQIIGGVDIRTLIVTVLAFTAAAVVLQAVKSYIDDMAPVRRIGLHMWVRCDLMGKIIATDYSNLENKKFTDAKQKANESNNSSAEQIYFTFVGVGANLLGFAVYIALLVNVNPLILLITAATSVLGFVMRRWANKWRHDHDEENAGYGKRIWYISSIGDNMALAKDIRIFGMVDWLRDIYYSYLNLTYNWHRRVQNRQFLADAVDCVAAFLREGAAYAFLIWLVLFQGLPVDQFVLLFAAIGGFSGWVTGILNE